MRSAYLNALFCPLVAAVFILCAAPAYAELPPAAQAAFDKGVVAAQQQEWEIASQSFQEARKAAPDAPQILYNLGLAESKMPGRELRSMAWFAAYLAARPDAPNAAAVIGQIDALDVRSQSNLARLVKDAANRENMAAVLRIADLLGGDWKNYAYDDLVPADFELAKAEAVLGNDSMAVEMVHAAEALMPMEGGAPGDAYSDIVNIYTDVGRLTTARQIAELAETAGAKSYSAVDDSELSKIWEDIAHAQLQAGDMAGASKSADRIPIEGEKREMQEWIGSRKAEAARPGAKAPTPADAQAVSAPDLIKAVFGDANEGSGMLDAPIFLNPVDYLNSLNSADPHDIIARFLPIRGIIGAEDWASAGKPLVLFCALAQAAATMAEGQRTTEHYTKAVIAQTLARADQKAQ